MTRQQFDQWLKDLKTAWESKNPNAAIDLVAEKFIWYDTPFIKPITNKQELLDEWQSILDHKDVVMTYEIICIKNNIGLAHWHATFIRIHSNEKVKLDGIYQVSLDENGKCTEFHQWYNTGG